MQSHIRSLTTVALAFGAITTATVVQGAEPIPIAGQFTCKIVEEQKSRVEGDPAHELILLKTSCDGHASGQSARFDGGQQMMVEMETWLGATAPYAALTLSNTRMAAQKPTPMSDSRSPR